MTAKIGTVRSHRLEEAIDGRARSERRSISGPSPGLGAAMRVRLGMTWLLKSFERP